MLSHLPKYPHPLQFLLSILVGIVLSRYLNIREVLFCVGIPLIIEIFRYLFGLDFRISLSVLILSLSYLIEKIIKRKVIVLPKEIHNLILGIGWYIIYGGACLIILKIWEIPIEPFLLGAGVLGLGFSLATKDLISNLIAGILIIIDKPFKIGDLIEIDGQKGIVETLTLRTIKLRKLTGEVVYIPCNKVITTKVVNYTENGKYIFELPKDKKDLVKEYIKEELGDKIVITVNSIEEYKNILRKI